MIAELLFNKAPDTLLRAFQLIYFNHFKAINMDKLSTKRKGEISLLGAVAICAVVIALRQLLKIQQHEELKIKHTGKIHVPGA